MSTREPTRIGRTYGKIYLCNDEGGALYHLPTYREGNTWYTAEGRVLKNYLTEVFKESSAVKFARMVIPAQGLQVFFALKNGQAVATYMETIDSIMPLASQTKRNMPTYEAANLGAKK